MEFIDATELVKRSGLRITLLRGMPSPWGQAAKAMMEYKGLEYLAGAHESGGENREIVAWSGCNSAPVVAWNDETPVNRWNDILHLLERLAPDRPLIPGDQAQRAMMMGLAYEICGELGFGWNRRLDLISAATPPGQSPGTFADKYGFNDADAEAAGTRSIAFLEHLAAVLERQAQRGSKFIVGDCVTAVDFYWAAFSNLVAIQPPDECPLDPAVRPMFERVSAEVTAATSPILIEHRNRMMQTYFRLPMEF